MGLQHLPIGISDFAKIMRSGQHFMDHSTRLIPGFITAAEISVVYYPRRFGKTLAGTMLAEFFDCHKAATSEKLFEKLAIIQHENGAYLQYRSQFPVIRFTFNSVSANSFDEFKESFAYNIGELYAKYIYLLYSPHIRENVKIIVKKTMDEPKSLSEAELKQSFKLLIEALYQHHFPTEEAKAQQIGQLSAGVMVFIDEYDAPLQHSFLQHLKGDPNTTAAASASEYTQIASFLKEVFKNAMKDKTELCKAFVTGVLEVARESLFSGMNNAKPYGMADEQYAGCFGFEQADVAALVEKLSVSATEKERYLNTMREWYNGYTVGSVAHQYIIYNPWSVMNYLADLPVIPQTYWLNTANNDLIKHLLTQATQEVRQQIVMLLSGQSIEVSVQERMTFDDIKQRSASLWGLLLQSGYVKVEKKTLGEPYPYYTLAIPNREIKRIFHISFLEWLHPQADISAYQRFVNALKQHKFSELNKLLNQYLLNAASYLDFKKADEARYHAFMLGIFLGVDHEYQVSSNRESGHGRYDISLFPRDLLRTTVGFLFEFKQADRASDQEQYAINALKQTEALKYQTEFINRGIQEIVIIGLSFHKKTVILKYESKSLSTSTSSSKKRPAPSVNLAPVTSQKLKLDDQEAAKSLLTGEWSNQRFIFEQHVTRGDGQCGFYALPIANDRIGAAQQLIEHAHRREIRVLLAPEIRAAIIENTLPTPMQNDFTKKWYSDYLSLSDDMHKAMAAARALFPQNFTDASSLQELINCLNQKASIFNPHNQQGKQLEKLQIQLVEHEQVLQSKLVEENALYLDFVNEYVGKTGHLSFLPQQTSSLDALAMINQWQVVILQDISSTGQLTVAHVAGLADAAQTHHLLHMGGVDSHFELLSVQSSQALTATPPAQQVQPKMIVN